MERPRRPRRLFVASILAALAPCAASRSSAAPSRAAPSDPGHRLATIMADDRQALSRVDAACRDGQPPAVLKQTSKALLLTIEDSRDTARLLPDGLQAQTACLRKAEMQAWTLSHLAESDAPRRDLLRQEKIVDEAFEECRWPEPIPESVRDVEKEIADADSLVRRQDALLGPGGPCSAGYSVEDLARDIAAGKYTWAEVEAIRGSGNYAVVRHFQFQALAQGSSNACAPFTPVEPIFVNDAMKSLRNNGMSCKGWVDEQLFIRAMVRKGPKLETKCRQYLANAYGYLSPDDRAEVCSVVSRDASRPERLCTELVARSFIRPGQLESCESSFEDYQTTDNGACKELNTQLYTAQRCEHQTDYARAYDARDEALCGQDQFCHALYSSAGAEAAAQSWGQQAIANTCSSFRARAQDKVDTALRLLALGSGFLARRNPADPDSEGAYGRRIRAVRQRATRLRRELLASIR